MRRAADTLFVLLQRILPLHLLTRVVYSISRIRATVAKNFLIRQFVRMYDVNVDELAAPVPDGFASLNTFFTRELAAGARQIDPGENTLVSPVDGIVSSAGKIESNQLFQAKGHRYSLVDLLMTDLPDCEKFRNGSYATLYLAPYNYHRVHAPLAGQLRSARYVPGDLFSVNATTVARLPGLFVRNERLICHFDGDAGPHALIFVGALNVGSISTPWTGEIRPVKTGVVVDCSLDDTAAPTTVAKGDLLGWFNMGSTVILLHPDGACSFDDSLQPGHFLRMGEMIGQTDAPRHDGS